MWNRTGSTTGGIYRDGVNVGSITTTSLAPANAAFLLLALNASTTGTVTPGSYSNKLTRIHHWGSQLTAGEITDTYNAFAAYLS